MAKKHASDRKPYSPVDAAFMRSLPTVFGAAPVEQHAQESTIGLQQETMADAAPATMLEPQALPANVVPLSAAERPKSSPQRMSRSPKRRSQNA